MHILGLIGLIIAGVSSLAAAISAFYSAKSSRITLDLYKKEKKEGLGSELNRILEIAIEYPYLESKKFTYLWEENKDKSDERYLRYDVYCNRLYNYLHDVCEYFDYEKEQIEDFIDVKNWIRIHKMNWLNPIGENENIDGYDEKFRKFIDSYLK